MKTKQLAEYRKNLIQMREEILESLKVSQVASREYGGDDVPDIGDVSSTTYNRDVLYSLGETKRQTLLDIDIALDLLDNDEYAICQSCGDDIAPKRMEVRPFSRYCIDCKTDVERFGER